MSMVLFSLGLLVGCSDAQESDEPVCLPVRYEYDEGDDGPNGRADHVETWVYDDEGRVIRHEEDDDLGGDADGQPNFVQVTDYERGKMIRRVTEDGSILNNVEGEPDLIETWEYDARGLKIRYDHDTNADGDVDVRESWEYDDFGREVRYEELYLPEEVNEIMTWQYQGGNLKRFEFDKYGDGRIDSVTTYDYEAGGNRICKNIDYDVDGEIDRVMKTEYDANGNLIRRDGLESTAFDDEQVVHVWKYDEHGRLVRHAFNYGTEPSTPNWVKTWEYDAEGKLVRHARHPGDETSTPSWVQTWEYDDDGIPVSSRMVHTRGFEQRIEYDELGNKVLRTDFADGEVSKIHTWEYDCRF